MMRKKKALALIGITAIMLCACSKPKIDLTNYDLPIKDFSLRWGMSEEELLKEFPADLIYRENEIDDGVTIKKTITVTRDLETEYGVSRETTFSLDNTPGLFSKNHDKVVGLYQVEFGLNNTDREELEKMIFLEYGQMEPATDEWEGNTGSEIPLEFYVPEGAKITDLNEKAQEKIKSFITYNLKVKFEGSSPEKEADNIMASGEILKIIIMGKSGDNGSALILRAYYLGVIENY